MADRAARPGRLPSPDRRTARAAVAGCAGRAARGPRPGVHVRQHRRAARPAPRRAPGRGPGEVRRSRTRRVLLRARRPVRGGTGAAGLRRGATAGTGRGPRRAADALRCRGDDRRGTAAGRPGIRDERAAADPARGRRRGRLRRLALPAAAGRHRCGTRLGARALARRALGADAHPRRAARCTPSTSPSGTTSPARTRPSTSGRCSCSRATSTAATSRSRTRPSRSAAPAPRPSTGRSREGELADWLDELDVPLTGDERVALDGVVRRLRG